MSPAAGRGLEAPRLAMRRATVADVLFGLVWFAAVVYALWFYGGALPFDEAVAVGTVCLAGALWVVGRGALGVAWAEVAPWLAWLAVAAFSLLWAPSLEEGLAWCAMAIAGLVSFAAGTTFARKRGGARLAMGILAAVGVAAAAWGFAQAAGLADSSFWLNKTHVASRFVNGSHFGALTVALAPPAASVALTARRRSVGVLLVGAVVVLTVGLALSRSRAAWIGMGVALVAWGLGVAVSEGGKRRAVLAVVLVCLVVAVSLAPVVAGRVRELGATDFWSMRQRLDIWRGCIAMLRARPAGVGAGCFEVAFPAHRVHSDRFFVNFAHNELLQAACELGPLGVVALGWLVCLVASAWYGALRRGGTVGVLASGAGGALLGLFVQSLVDFPLHLPALAFIAALLAGVVVGLGREGAGRGLRWLVALLALLAALWSGLAARGLWRLTCADELMESKRYPEALAAYEAAARVLPLLSRAWEGQGRVHAIKATLGGGPEEAKAAISAYRRALEARRGEALYHLNISWMYLRLGDEEAAEESLRTARRLAPQDGNIALELARYLIRRGRCEEGLGELAAAMRLFRREGRPGETARLFDLALERCCGPERLVDLLEDNGPALIELGDYLLRLGMKEEAARAYQAARLAARRDPRAEERLGRIGYDLR